MRLQLRSLVAAVAVLFASIQSTMATDLLFVPLRNNTLVRYDVSLGSSSAVSASALTMGSASNLNLPVGVAVDSAGVAYVSNNSGNSIAKFDSSGSYLGSIGSASTLSKPQGMAINSAGNLVVSNSNNGVVRTLSTTGTDLGSITDYPDFGSTGGLAIDSAGRYLISRPASNVVYRVDASGANKVTLISSSLNYPVGIALDSSGNIFVANYNSNQVTKYNSSGSYLSSFGDSTNTNGAFGLAFDSGGNIYVSNFNSNSISKYNSAGTFQFSWSVAGIPGLMTVVSVPEPSTYALCAIATGVMTAVARRRKARKA